MKRPAILLVEDNPTARKMVRIALEVEGYRVIEAEDGRAALANMTSDPPDLVLQDLMLPDMDGVELAQRLRALARGKEVPFIALSGFVSVVEQAKATPCGFDASLVKPVEPSRLVEVIRSFLPSPPPLSESNGSGKHVLVVDDDPIQLRLTTLRLNRLGFRVTPVSAASSAVDRAKQDCPDVILSDVLMPDMDGFELSIAVRREPSLAHVPIVLVSASYVDEPDRGLAGEVGAQALVQRTSDFEEAIVAIEAALRASARPSFAPEKLGEEHSARVLEQLRRQAGTNSSLAQRCALQTAQLAILGGIADALARNPDVENALRDVLCACLDAGGISKGALYRVGDQGELVIQQAVGFTTEERAEVDRIIARPEVLDRIASTSRVLGASVLAPDEGPGILAGAGLATAVIAPLTAEGTRTGIMLLGSASGDVTEQDLVTFARAVGAFIGQALGLASAFERLEMNAEANRVLFSSLDMQGTLRCAAKLGLRMADLCDLQLSEKSPALRHAWAHRNPEMQEIARELHERYPKSPGTFGSVSERPTLTPEVTELARESVAIDADHLRLLRAIDVQSEIVVPLVAHGSIMGTMRFGSSRKGHYGAKHLTAAEDLARRVAAAVDNARLYQLAQEANRAKDEFLTTLSHELRTPLTGILLWTARLLSKQSDAVTLQRGLEAIDRSGKLQARLIEDLLDVSRIVTGKLPLETRIVDLVTVIRAAMQIVSAAAEAKAIRLELVVDPNLAVVMGDGERLQQVFWNLLVNAVKFTPGGGRIEVRVGRVASSVEVRVSDNGKGIEPGFLPFVFDRFRQAETSIARTEGGLGLGLAIVRHLVELHGGTVRAESEGDGHGATFVVCLPVPATFREWPESKQGAGPATNLAESSASLARGSLRGVRLLIVDDDPEVRELLAQVVAEVGAEVASAASAAEAFSALEHFQPTILVSDLGMPGQDGYAFIEGVRRFSTIPALALTAYADPEHQDRALEAGFQTYLVKPIEPAAFVGAVASLAARMSVPAKPSTEAEIS